MAEKERFELSLPLSSTTPLAGEPLRPLGYFSMIQLRAWKQKGKWRRERDSNPRCLSASLVFKTSAINPSAIPPRLRPTALPEALIYYSISKCKSQPKNEKFAVGERKICCRRKKNHRLKRLAESSNGALTSKPQARQPDRPSNTGRGIARR